jgi:hypothetical protein
MVLSKTFAVFRCVSCFLFALQVLPRSVLCCCYSFFPACHLLPRSVLILSREWRILLMSASLLLPFISGHEAQAASILSEEGNCESLVFHTNLIKYREELRFEELLRKLKGFSGNVPHAEPSGCLADGIIRMAEAMRLCVPCYSLCMKTFKAGFV